SVPESPRSGSQATHPFSEQSCDLRRSASVPNTRKANPSTLRSRIAGLGLLLGLLPLAFAVDAERTLPELEHTRWTLADEAPGQIGAIAQTADGYLWLASGASLYRFDGVRFTRYADL